MRQEQEAVQSHSWGGENGAKGGPRGTKMVPRGVHNGPTGSPKGGQGACGGQVKSCETPGQTPGAWGSILRVQNDSFGDHFLKSVL